MSWTVVPLSAATPQAWRNGGGTTRELLAWPSPADWRVRMSVADVVAAGPFSRFEGVERWFAVLEGGGVILQVEGREQRLLPASEPLRFDGAAAVGCDLIEGATRDFNLMSVGNGSHLRRVRGELQVSARAGALLAVYAHAHPAHVELAGDAFSLPPRHFAWRLQPSAAEGVVRGDDALWMEARP